MGRNIYRSSLAAMTLALLSSGACTKPVPTLRSLEEFAEMASSSCSMVRFGAPYCGPCHKQGPVFASIAQEHPGWNLAYVDGQASEDIAEVANAKHFPQIVVYRSGVEVDRREGFSGREEREEILAMYERNCESTSKKGL